ncbi:MAG: TonB-dependent receptor [Alphaproteobacteria bacterium]|nr:MAG: TonB-dependent receptor [Alphaproteobacteria bacterium]
MSSLTYLKATSALISLSLMSGVFTSAQAAEGEIVLEEIVVTSQHREQSLKDVPISVSVVSGDFMKKQSITKMADLQFSVPNFTMAESGIGTNVFIRGIGSGNNQGFEQSVGIYVDGIHHGRAQQSRAPFLDLARVEVLRGPQSILFGKNSVAGALNITTAKPTEEFEGSVSFSYEPTDNEKEATLVLSGPVSDKIRVRMAARYHDLNGYIENLTLGGGEPNQEDWTLRGTIEMDVSDNLTATLKVERSKFDVIGRNMEIDGELPGIPILANGSPNPFAGLLYSQVLGIFGQDASVANNTIDGKRHSNGDFSNNEQTEIVLTLDWQMGEHVLTSISGYSDFKFDDLCDCDFTGGDIFNLPLSEQYEQFSQEIRLTSPGGEKVDYILGAYFQTSNHNYQDAIEVNSTSVLVPALNGNPAFAPFGPIFAVNGLAGAGDLFADTKGPREAKVDAKVYSAFAQLSWHMTDDLTLQLGGRLTHEKKDGSRNITITNLDGSPLTGVKASLTPDFYALAFDIGSSNVRGAALGAEVLPLLTAFYTGLLGPVAGPPTAAAIAGAFGAKAGALGSHPVAGSRTETKFSPDVKLTYQVSDDAMLYASWVKGSKSGGFDFRANNKGASATMEDAFQFEDENATNYELGGKMVLADGAAELNFAAFFTKFTDLQVSIFDGTLGFNVGNAAKAEVKGLEMDGRWQASESLTLTGSLAYTDFQFKDYADGQCFFGQTPDKVVNGNSFCDYSGKTQQLVSEWQGTLGFNHFYNVSSDLTINTSANMFYTSSYHASPQLDPKLIQPGYATISARIALTSDSGWELALLGENLTDHTVRLFAADAPLSGSTFGTIANYSFLNRGRTVKIQASMNF